MDKNERNLELHQNQSFWEGEGGEGVDCIAERRETLLSIGHLIECWREKK